MKWIKRIAFLIVAVLVVVPATARIAATLRETDNLDQALPDPGRLVDTAMGRIFILEGGPAGGIPVLLAHGTAAWSGLWGDTIDALAAEGYRAIAFDMPPFGYSDRADDGNYSRTRQAERLNALVVALELRPVLVAHSFGAGPGVEAVMAAPETYAGLIVVDGALGLDNEPEKAMPFLLRPTILRQPAIALTVTNPLLTRRLLASLIYVKSAATPEIAHLLQRPMTRQGTTAAYANWLPSLLVPSVGALSMDRDNYRALDLPTVVIWGSEDHVTPPAQGAELADLIPGASLVSLPDAGHIPQIEVPEAFQQVLIDALRGMENRN